MKRFNISPSVKDAADTKQFRICAKRDMRPRSTIRIGGKGRKGGLPLSKGINGRLYITSFEAKPFEAK
jgi:hypothetical protein